MAIQGQRFEAAPAVLVAAVGGQIDPRQAEPIAQTPRVGIDNPTTELGKSRFGVAGGYILPSQHR